MGKARSRWVLQQQPADRIEQMAAAAQVSPLVATLLLNRGVQISEAPAFLQPQLRDMPDPWLMADAQPAAERVARAIADGEQICVYGDYDVDGVTAAALLSDYLKRVGAKVRVFLPDRFRDGYGLNHDRLQELCDQGVELFISVDCGSKAMKPIAAVRDRGLDFIVVDHHLLGAELPAATALLNPRRPDCDYPQAELCAAGVATVLVQGLRRALVSQGTFTRQTVPGFVDLLQLTGLGTIADMVPLHGLNRTFAWHGLNQLTRSQRPGVLALAEQARVQGKLGSDHVGFALAPRINAAGRISDARTAFELLTTERRDQADELARQIDLENNKRRGLQREAEEQAVVVSEEQAGREHAVVVADESWHSGVVGIVASRLKDRHHVPTFVLSVDGDVARGSGRSIPGYDLVAGLDAIQEASGGALLSRYGGHYFAAGVTLPVASVPTFREALIAHVSANLPTEARVPELLIDAALDVDEASLELVDEMQALEPFGKGNRKPLFLMRGVTLASVRFVGAEKKWMQADLVDADSDRPLWSRPRVRAFGARDLLGETLGKGDTVDLVCRLELNIYRNQRNVQAKLLEMAPVGQTQWVERAL